MLDNLRAAWTVPDIRGRIGFVFLAFALFVYAIHVQIPGVNVPRWQQLRPFMDPKFSSSFWRRVSASTT